MKICDNGIIRDMTPEEEKAYRSDALTTPTVNPQYPSYDEKVTYTKGDCVEFYGGIWRLKTERARGIEPTDKTYWENISLADLIKEISKENEQ